MPMRNILQIAHAGTWQACFKLTPQQIQAGISGSGGPIQIPLACWALVEESGGKQVIGMIADKGATAIFVDEDSNFVGYRSN